MDFLRTLRHRGTPDVTEELAGPEALAAWVAQCGPCGGTRAVPPHSGVELLAAVALREAL
ncbi:ABATE domain-containing protein [Streptomyces sp.]|uniref:ABATE domain-containing protein n=1 Tax=Streptomyces sp. TaxID=1931 RepID=UPI0039C95CA1